MKKIKGFLCVLLSMLLLLQAPLSVLAEETAETETVPESAEEMPAENEEAPEIPEELWVGHPTITKGDFFTEMFGNDTADIDVRALIHGYNLVNWDQNQGVYVIDPTVVVDEQLSMDELGNKTYTLLLAQDLYYSDGTQITAWDYAFSLLLMMEPEIEKLGGKIYRAEHILGYDDYIEGRRKAIAGEDVAFKESVLGGVNVIDNFQLTITLDHEFLPYFFETGLLLCVPYPISVIAPGCKVYDDGWGIYIGNEDPSVEEPLFTADLLRKTILDEETGYNTHPSVVSGPYTITSWDGTTGHFVINPYFKGAWFHNTLPGGNSPTSYEPLLDAEGNQMQDREGNLCYLVKPTIEKIAFTEADNDTLIQKLADGELHLVNKVTYGPTIQDGLMHVGEYGITGTPYPRIGLAFLTFTYDWPTVHDKEVRQAIAWCMDRDALTNKYCGDVESGMSFGVRVDGYFGIEQWEYQLVTHQIDFPVNFLEDDLHTGNSEEEDLTKKYKNRYVRTQADYDAAVAAWETLSLDNLTIYEVNLDRANALLDDAGWTLNKEGNPYQAGVDTVRCKMIDGELISLELKMMYPEGNHMAEFMQEDFIPNLNEVGITLELVPTPMQELFYSYYRQTERTTDMIYLATNFHVIVDPSITYSTDNTLNHQIWNNTYSDDEDLYYRAVDMRKTEPGDVFDYVTKWVAFQERYNEVLPTIPIYSNIYFDFFTNQLKNYFVTSQVTWSQAILQSYFSLDTAEEEEDGEELGDDEAIFDDEF